MNKQQIEELRVAKEEISILKNLLETNPIRYEALPSHLTVSGQKAWFDKVAIALKKYVGENI